MQIAFDFSSRESPMGCMAGTPCSHTQTDSPLAGGVTDPGIRESLTDRARKDVLDKSARDFENFLNHLTHWPMPPHQPAAEELGRPQPFSAPELRLLTSWYRGSTQPDAGSTGMVAQTAVQQPNAELDPVGSESIAGAITEALADVMGSLESHGVVPAELSHDDVSLDELPNLAAMAGAKSAAPSGDEISATSLRTVEIDQETMDFEIPAVQKAEIRGGGAMEVTKTADAAPHELTSRIGPDRADDKANTAETFDVMESSNQARVAGMDAGVGAGPMDDRVEETGSVPSVASQIAQEMMSRADSLDREGRTEFHMQLDPPELGSVRVHLVADHNTLSARFVVGSEDVRQIVESQMNTLRNTLAELGVSLDHCDVSYAAHDQAREQSRHDAGRPHVDEPVVIARRPAPVMGSPSRFTARGRIDVMV